MNIEAHILQSIHTHGLQGNVIIVGVSGGKDSMLLLHLLQKMPLQLIVAHVNYGLRGDESDNETAFVQNYCDQHQLLLEMYHPNVSNKDTGIQEWARNERYRFFSALKIKHDARAIAVAHHLQDQAETVFFHFMRGGGLKSISGMAPFENGVWRPLLSCPLPQLQAYITQEKLAFCEDSSNASTAYSRNFIRHDLAGRLDQLFPNWAHRITQRGVILQELHSALAVLCDQQEGEWLKVEHHRVLLNIHKWEKMTMRHYRLWYFLDKNGFGSGLHEQIALLTQSAIGSKLELGEWCIWRERAGLVLERAGNYEMEALEIQNAAAMAGLLRGWHITRTKYATVAPLLDGKERVALRCAALQFPITIRQAQTGDRMQPFGMTGHKLVSKIFISKKIEQKDKGQFPVWCHGKEIYWLETLVVGEQCRAKEEDDVYFIEKRRMAETL
jgi:tRNA(Ile)-lysidine synthase